jgi:hypothetical protein
MAAVASFLMPLAPFLAPFHSMLEHFQCRNIPAIVTGNQGPARA